IMALGEHKANLPTDQDILFVKVATGIGAGIIAGGNLERGAQGTAGDLGHVRVPGGPETLCTCGNVGCLEAVASGPAIALKLGLSPKPGQNIPSLVAQQVRDGDAAAIAAVRQAGRDLGSVLATCVSLLNPSVIVVGGSLAQVGEHLLAGIREVVYQRSLPLATKHLRIIASSAGSHAGVLGAVALATEFALSPKAVEGSKPD
ncbi:ROK family protein, partial [Arthrobacter rhombi]